MTKATSVHDIPKYVHTLWSNRTACYDNKLNSSSSNINNLRASPCLNTGFFLNIEHVPKQSSRVGSITNRTSPIKTREITTAPDTKDSYKPKVAMEINTISKLLHTYLVVSESSPLSANSKCGIWSYIKWGV